MAELREALEAEGFGTGPKAACKGALEICTQGVRGPQDSGLRTTP